ncbi:MAG TPA: PorP/SprF family type IX secretion system membrane protein [Bacteroidales bacterium]|nr:hypothetical protein [Bacteroidales bacterium]HQG36552.1 PorP/SprF family type IX secretion system membrane protein [Bacteroidales bacterium]HQG53042.1 PorP/SprF family type IX secretion system membrane protein [Bacteroidales bacterium]HRC89362.1 PorP/SprF family type IX secretion system membrane protein [Bacteroidales bacterium]
MKRTVIIIILSGIIGVTGKVFSQQSPLSENYYMDCYSIMPSYAGQFKPKYLVTDYRSDWSGISGGPKTLRITYNDRLPVMNGAGVGAKLIYDKAGIFRHLYISGSYSYKVSVADGHNLLFGLSAGLYHNTINLTEYYNDPNYTIDPSLISYDVKSKIKFMSDFSVLYTWQNLEAGFLFSNISFGDASYKEVPLKYSPLSNFQFHAIYHYDFDENWSVSPLLIVRGGKYVKSQLEIATQVVYMNRFRGSVVFRDPAVVGAGLGINILKGLDIAYNFNLAFDVAPGAFNNHEFAIGVNLLEYIGTKKQ